MSITQQLPRKHSRKPVNQEQETIIEEIQKEKGWRTWLEAKHEYFERQAFYDKRAFHDKAIKVSKEVMSDAENEVKKEKKGSMTIEQTKLGVTMVLSKGDCYKLGFLEGASTKAVVKEVRKKLGLPEKSIKELK